MDNSNLFVTEQDTIAIAMERINRNLLKVALVLRENKLIGTIGDGDIRRALMKGLTIEDLIGQAMNDKPIFIYESNLREADEILKTKKISILPVLNCNNEVVDIKSANYFYQRLKPVLSVPVIIMAGGKGTRLYPYTKILPKPLIPIGELPIVEHIIHKFYHYGCNVFYMIVNYKKNMIHSYFDYVSHDYELLIVDEEEVLGTGGGLSLLKNIPFDNFFLTNCDVIIDADYHAIFEDHKKNKNFITIVCAKKQNKIPYGVIMTGDNNVYTGIKEKPNYEVIINTGLYLVNGRVVTELEEHRAINFPDIIELYKEKGEKIGVYVIEEEAFMDMGQMAELDDMCKRIGGLED